MDASILPIEESNSDPLLMTSNCSLSNQVDCAAVSHQSRVSIQLNRCKDLLAKLQNEFSEEDEESYWAERLRLFRARTESGLRNLENESREEPVGTDELRDSEDDLRERRDDDLSHACSTLANTVERDRISTVREDSMHKKDKSQISYRLSTSSKGDPGLVNQVGWFDVTEADTAPHSPGSIAETDAREPAMDDSRGQLQQAAIQGSINANKSDSKKRKIVKLLLKSLQSMKGDNKQPSHGGCVIGARGPEQSDDLNVENGALGASVSFNGQESRDNENLSTGERRALIAEDVQQQQQQQQRVQDEVASREQDIVIAGGDQRGYKPDDTLEETTKQIHQRFESLRNVFDMWRFGDAEVITETNMGTVGIDELANVDDAKMDPFLQAAVIDNAELGKYVGNEAAKSVNAIGQENSEAYSNCYETKGAAMIEGPSPRHVAMPSKFPEIPVSNCFPSESDENHAKKIKPLQHADENVICKNLQPDASIVADKSVLLMSSRNPQGKLAETATDKKEARVIQDLGENVLERKQRALIDISRLKKPAKKNHHALDCHRIKADSKAAEPFSAPELRKADSVKDKTFDGKKKSGRTEKGQHRKTFKSTMVKGLDLAISSITRTPSQNIAENSTKHVVVEESPVLNDIESIGQTSAREKRATVLINPGKKEEELNKVVDSKTKNLKDDKKARKKEKGTRIKLLKQHRNLPQSQNSDTETAKLSASTSKSEDIQAVVTSNFTEMGKPSKTTKPKVEGLELEICRITQPHSQSVIETSSGLKVVEESSAVQAAEKPPGQLRPMEDPKAKDEELGQSVKPLEVNEKPKKDKKARKEKKKRKEQRQEKREKRVKLRKKVGSTWAIDESKDTGNGLVDTYEGLVYSRTEVVKNKEDSLDTIFCSKVSKHERASGTESKRKNSTLKPHEKALSWSDEVHDREAPPILPPQDVQSVIWWSTSKDAVEIMYDEEDEISSESESVSSAGSTHASDDSSFQTIDFSFSTLLDVTETLVEEAAIIKQDFVNEVRRKASGLIGRWMPQKTNDQKWRGGGVLR